MSRVRQIVKGALALGLLLGLLVGVPYLLVAYVGWPLPHGLPTWSQFTTALGTRGIPDETLLKALALAIWIALASLAAAVLAEVAAVVRGRTAGRLPVAGFLQPIAGHLLAAVLVGALALGRPLPSPRLSLPSAGTSPNMPVAAVLVANVTLSAPATNGTAPTAAPATVTYIVRPDDTLWGIAAARLGNAERWQEIFELNRGRPQADGKSLANPHWIYPGWVLELPAATHPVHPEPTRPRSAEQHTSAPGSAPATTVPAAPKPSPVGPTAPVASSEAPNTAHSSAHVGPRGDERRSVGQTPQRLPSGSLVGASFAAAILALLGLARLRRRDAYRYRPPEPGRDLTRPPLGLTLRALRQQIDAEEPADEDSAPGAAPPMTRPADLQSEISALELGVKDGRPIRLDREALSLISLNGGPGADDVARYLLDALVVERGRGAVELTAERRLLDELLPGVAELSAVWALDDEAAVVRSLEVELLARSRRLAENDLPDLGVYREVHPEEPVPMLVAALRAPGAALAARLEAIAEAGRRLDVVVLVLGGAEHGSHLYIGANRRVIEASPDLADFADAELYALRADEASELTAVLVAAEPDEEPEVATDFADDQVPVVASSSEPWPEPAVVSEARRTVEVRVLGAYRLFAHGNEITRGRRRAAKELLAWHALRPEGATAEAAVDAIWPDTEPDRVSKRFWLALGDLRTLCRDPSGEIHVEVLVKRGERYSVDAEAVSIDLWEFQARLGDAARASDPEEQRLALRSAVELYRGDLAEDEDYLWIAPAREDLHRRALDAHLRLAELEEQLDAPERAVEVLERAIALDQYAEEPYRRVMTLLARLERFDGVEATWRSLQRALADLGIEPERDTLALYKSLSSARDRVRTAS